MKNYQRLTKIFTKEEEDSFFYAIPWIEWGRCPSWQGNFESKIYGRVFKKDHGLPPKCIQTLVKKASTLLAPDTKFTVTFLQKQEKGTAVKAHRTPKSNVDKTVVVSLGAFEGGASIINGSKVRVTSGDILVYNCYQDNGTATIYEETPIIGGTKYNLVLCSTI